MYEYTGIIHVHSKYSDGSGNLDDIVGPARKLQLDFVVLTDHMTLEPRDAGWEGYHGKVLLAVGYEHHAKNQKNHYLIIGPEARVLSADLSPAQYVAEARQLSCAGFLAHPAEKRKAIPSLPAFPWDAWDAKEFDGIEIWNQLSDWVEQVTRFNLVYRILFPRRFLKPPSPDLLAKWDSLTQIRPVSIVGGADTHALLYQWGILRYTLIPYKVGFQCIRTHLLQAEERTGNFEEDYLTMVAALRKGSSYVSNFRLGDARGSRFWIEDGETRLGPGNECRWKKGISLTANIPLTGKFFLYRNGEEIHVQRGKAAEFRPNDPGVYRWEVKRKRRSWIYTNPFYLRG